MTVEIKVPALGESVTEATVARWLRQPVPATAPLAPAVAAWCLGWLGLSLAGPGRLGALALGLLGATDFTAHCRVQSL